MAEAPPELLDALWEAAEHYGVQIAAPDQVVVARALAVGPVSSRSSRAVDEAFVQAGMPRPPVGFGKAVIDRWRALGGASSLVDVIVEYRQFAIGSLSRQFGGKTTGREEELRNNLHTYLPQHGFKEAQTGKGNTDIVIPGAFGAFGANRPAAIIEVKVWTDVRTYEDGLEELGRYIHTDMPTTAFMVVFGDRDPLPEIIKDATQVVAEERPLSGLMVPVIVVPFEVDYPSKARSISRRRSRDGR